ncbi:unnamed protein product [Xylocopa violacea]|uniref:Uncharacterized protein n=1 Tax=Xylocopa violacea TaxID=135666 RepID=A0ABP1P9S3_XYLVO
MSMGTKRETEAIKVRREKRVGWLRRSENTSERRRTCGVASLLFVGTTLGFSSNHFADIAASSRANGAISTVESVKYGRSFREREEEVRKRVENSARSRVVAWTRRQIKLLPCCCTIVSCLLRRFVRGGTPRATDSSLNGGKEKGEEIKKRILGTLRGVFQGSKNETEETFDRNSAYAWMAEGKVLELTRKDESINTNDPI